MVQITTFSVRRRRLASYLGKHSYVYLVLCSGSYKEVIFDSNYHIYTNSGIFEDRLVELCILIYIAYINVGADVRLVVAARSWKGTSTTPCKSLACVCDFT